ncbi:MAG: ferritin family protein [candidate division KSB1 bacterium]|nr:ferritin family protein [candidate division KSB1 bacterium]
MGTKDNQLKALSQAIRLEQDGIEFYQNAAKRTKHPKSQEIFRTLAKEEQHHLDMVKQQYQSLSGGQGWINFYKSVKEDIGSGKSLFPKGKEGLEKAVGPRTTELEALAFALEIEDKSHEWYQNSASETQDEAGKNMYLFLADEERRHFELLMLHYESIIRMGDWAS